MIMKKIILLFTIFFMFMYINSQNLDTKTIEEIQSSFKLEGSTKALQNAVSNNSVKKLALNRENVDKVDHFFKYKVDIKGITNQKQSGRCWMFTSLNIFRPQAMTVFNIDAFEFSENYLYFWDIFEKANLFLNNIISTANKPIDDRLVQWYLSDPVSDGGVWNSFTNLVDKYGLMPKEAMPETNSSENTRDVVKFINLKLKEDALRLRDGVKNGAKTSVLQNQKKAMLKEVYRMLALNLGVPPKKFTWRYKDKNGKVSDYVTYTPQQFRDKVLGGIRLSDYVMIMNDPTRPFYKHYEIENYRNVQEGDNWNYVNLPNDKIKEMAIASIKDSVPMYASCDVGKQLDGASGTLDLNNYDYNDVYGVKFGMTKAERIETKASGSSHGMALVAVDVDKAGKPTKWEFENSWGGDYGDHGFLTFTDEWFDNYLFRIVINKKYVTADVIKIYNSKPTMLPPWDWMF